MGCQLVTMIDESSLALSPNPLKCMWHVIQGALIFVDHTLAVSTCIHRLLLSFGFPLVKVKIAVGG